MSHPQIIQGGMGVAVSGWLLARTVSRLGQLGVVSGTALAVVLARRLQLGDPPGELRHALAQFPFPQIAAQVLAEYFIPGGKAPSAPFKLTPMPTVRSRRELVNLTVVSNYVEVFLAKLGHQLPRKDPTADAGLTLWRDARRCGLHPDGRGHPTGHSRRAGPSCTRPLRFASCRFARCFA